MKEMLGGCCVCSDERGWTENPLVYCDGQGCTVAVHQACYGIVTVPTGPWYCRKCESQERSTRVEQRCELCPSRDGALKRTDQAGWAHVVCALYIPEVRFGNVTTMEPIILQLIPSERFSKTCYICEEQGRGSRANVGACMQCNKTGCRQQFHVTCAQALGLLCEEAGNYLDNVKYCGYCQHHYSKLVSKSKKKGGNVKTIPPYKPIPADNGSSDSSPEKEAETPMKSTSTSSKRKSSSSKSATSSSKKATSLSTTTEPEKSKKLKVESPPIQPSISTSIATEATTTPVIMSISHSHPSAVTQSPTTISNSIVVSVPLTATSLPSSVQSVVTNAPTLYQQLQESMITTAVSKDTRTNVMPNAAERFLSEDQPMKRCRSQSSDKPEKTRKPKRGSTPSSQPATTVPLPLSASTATSTTVSNNTVVSTTKRGARSNHQTPPPSITVAPIPSIIQGPTLGTGHFSSVGSGSVGTMGPTVKESPPSSPGSESMSSSGPGRRKRKSAGAASTTPTPSTSNTPTTLLSCTKEEKDVKLFQNGVSAPHMLGNQLNPTSTMAQKMSDTLSQELEAHSIFTESNNPTTSLVGPQLHSRVIASIRSNQPTAPAASLSSVFSTNSNTNSNNVAGVGTLGGGAIPQTLDQLLERQWEQGSQFLMEQAQHFDSEFASLLSCLHQLRAENLRLEEHVNSLLQRRDHLLAVNARLAIPLTTQPSTHPVNNIHPTVNPSHPNIPHPDIPPGAQAQLPRVNRESRVNNTYLPHSSSSSHSTAMENGLPPDPSPPAAASLSQYQHRGSLVPPQPSPTIRHSPAGSGYHQGQPSNIVTAANANNSGVVRNSSVTPDPLRGVPRSVPQSSSSYMPSMYQPAMSNLTSSQAGASMHNLHSHGPSPTSHGPPGKPS
ncbi:protein AF-10 isoform X10 [Cephus cinctus]|uniref:Protein AF-10 isoform X10 n=1 Tax=Cephus cinctus TaxID=211228 RepID=A0AAJ7RNN4_CEPCN|nr:protein AF-10 isoform X10 [Cephus cinctus]